MTSARCDFAIDGHLPYLRALLVHLLYASSETRLLSCTMGQMLSIERAWRRCITTPGLIMDLILGKTEGAHLNIETNFQDEPKDMLQILPTELVLHIFSFLELKPYIISHGVCKEWQRLLPLANIHPIRRRLFDLFHDMLSSPHFLETRKWTLEHLQPFDRQAYIDSLLSQYPHIPEEFQLWILEWPARMVICCMWPGLPFVRHGSVRADETSGAGWLSYNPDAPELLTVVYKDRTPDVKYIPALLVWRSSFATTWLIFERDEDNLFGRVLVNDDYLGEHPSIFPEKWKILEDESERREGPEVVFPYFNTPFPDWITYQEYRWNSFLGRVFSRPLPTSIIESRFIQGPVEFEFGSGLIDELPSPSWIHRNEAIYHGYLQRQ